MIIWNFSLFLSTMYKCVKLFFLYQSMQMSKLVLFSLIIDIQLDYNIYIIAVSTKNLIKIDKINVRWVKTVIATAGNGI